jgi:hypothetical protein
MTWIDDLVKGSPIQSKIGFRGELEFFGASEGDTSGQTVKFRIIRAPEELLLANPFSQFTRRRGKRVGTIFEGSVVSVVSGEPVYTGELMLSDWGDGPQGASVKFWLDMGGDRNPFMGYTRPTASAAGSRFMAVLLEKTDSGQVVEQAKAIHIETMDQTGKKSHKQRLSNAVAIIIKQPRFLDWMRENVRGEDWTEKTADNWVKMVVQIASKSELDDPKNQAAIDRWETIRRRYVNWQYEQGYIDSREI